MTDIFSKQKRSEVMSRIRSRDTRAEKLAFRTLRKDGIYFQKHYKRVVGTPDIALPRKRKALFIDGDFWHGKYYQRRKKVFQGIGKGKSSEIYKGIQNMKKSLKEKIGKLCESGKVT